MSEPSHLVPLYWRKRFHEQFQTKNFSFVDDATVSIWHREGKIFYSGFHGPFGGFYSDKKDNTKVTSEHVKNLLDYIRLENESMEHDVDVKVRLFPERIFPNWAESQLSALTTAGFYKNLPDTAHYIMLGTALRENWSRNRSRDFKKSVERIYGMQIRSDHEILALYDVITKNADYKNRNFSLSLENLKRMSALLSTEDMDLWLYKSTITGNNIAAAICQIVDHNVVYVFRWGHVYNYKDYGLESSPMTFVADQLCQEYSSRGFAVLYLGASSVEGVLDVNLSHFKESLGALQTTVESMTLKSLFQRSQQ